MVTKRDWQFDKTISLGTLISIGGVIIGLGGPILLWGRAMETSNALLANRVQVLEAAQEQYVKSTAARIIEERDQQKEFLARMDKFSEQVTALRITLGGPARK